MTDLSATVEAKSNQLNADDLIGGSKTIKVTNVSAVSGEQPIAVNFEGDNGKPFMPCKSMRRALIQVWGANGKEYIGKSMTLYRDPAVKFGGIAVGGIRISHMSHIDKPVQFPLTESRASRKIYTVKPLVVEEEPAESYFVSLSSGRKGFATIKEWQGWLELNLPKIKPEQVDGFKQRNQSLFDEYAKEHPEAVSAVEGLFTKEDEPEF